MKNEAGREPEAGSRETADEDIDAWKS